MMLMAYLSYMLAEVSDFSYVALLMLSGFTTDCLLVLQLLDLSGILTVFFCGIVMSHYTWHNVTEKSRITTK